jgi:hypothetical protein
MRRMMTFLGGIGLGVGAMYVLDPDRGGRRRALIRDQAVRLYHDGRDFLGKAGRDLGNRAKGALAETKGIVTSHAPDDVLSERVRSKIGRHVSHPRAIEVSAQGGAVTLSGPILEEESQGLLRAVSAVRGVSAVHSRLEPHRRDENIPALQGGAPPPGEPAEWAQANWTPGLRLLAGIASAAAVGYALSRKRMTSSSPAIPTRTIESFAAPGGLHRSPRHTRQM